MTRIKMSVHGHFCPQSLVNKIDLALFQGQALCIRMSVNLSGTSQTEDIHVYIHAYGYG